MCVNKKSCYTMWYIAVHVYLMLAKKLALLEMREEEEEGEAPDGEQDEESS